MINKDSIVTAYDEHLTLVEWLQKVETALKDAVLTGVTINKKGNATLSFVFTFEDGTTLETDDIILQQGESVQGATIRNGHLILTLTNGDELDAGNMFNGNLIINGALSTPILTSVNDEIEAQKPVVEVMTGYSFIDAEIVNATKETIYAGAVKNGNKLTFVCFQKINLTEAYTSEYLPLCYFQIPTTIAKKLNSVYINNANLLSIVNLTFFYGVGLNQKASLNGMAQRYASPDRVFLQAYGVQTLAKNVDYYVRFEITFLLSENLAE